jgi:large subunit ribosomal protein L7/L12
MPVAAAAPAAASAAPAAEQAQEKSEYKVVLQSSGSEKIKVIKELRALVSTLSLTDAKTKVEEAPTVIGESIAKEDALKMKKALEAVGATVTLS